MCKIMPFYFPLEFKVDKLFLTPEIVDKRFSKKTELVEIFFY